VRQNEIDAWMFLGVAFGRDQDGRAPLDRVVGAADGLNHAIPSRDELTGGLNRLIAAGFLAQSDDAFSLSPAGETLHAKVQRRAGQRRQVDRLAFAFAGLKSPRIPLWTPDGHVLDDAIAEYLERWAKADGDMKDSARSPGMRSRRDEL